jgi:hypothetical protein
VALQLSADDDDIAPVPAADFATARIESGHSHVGVDTKYLPPMTVIANAAVDARR